MPYDWQNCHNTKMDPHLQKVKKKKKKNLESNMEIKHFHKNREGKK